MANISKGRNTFADVYTFSNGKAIQMRSFGERQEALEWVGAKASDET